ncbi:MAG: ComF family protein [Roseburia sp.]|nr:ComF family protein [Roseburia sp.]
MCRRILERAGDALLCGDCQKKLHPVTEPRCKRCSKPLGSMEEELCEDCQGRTFCVERGYALYPYDSLMKKAVRNFKYDGELSCGDHFAGELADTYGDWIREISPDVLIPVPIHKKRMRFRGFNQAEYMASVIGERLGIRVLTDYLIRTKNTKPQKGLDVKSRTQNLQKRFRVVTDDLHFKKVLLVDDIYTTGSTLEACGEALKNVGTERIYFLCLCIGRGDPAT